MISWDTHCDPTFTTLTTSSSSETDLLEFNEAAEDLDDEDSLYHHRRRISCAAMEESRKTKTNNNKNKDDLMMWNDSDDKYESNFVSVSVSGALYKINPNLFRKLDRLPWTITTTNTAIHREKNTNNPPPIVGTEPHEENEQNVTPSTTEGFVAATNHPTKNSCSSCCYHINTSPYLFDIIFDHVKNGYLPNLEHLHQTDLEELEPMAN